jgi:hypothetical protein
LEGSSATKEALAIFRKGTEDPRMEKTYFTGKVKGPDGNFIKDGDADLEYKPDAIALDVSGTTFEKTAERVWQNTKQILLPSCRTTSTTIGYYSAMRRIVDEIGSFGFVWDKVRQRFG